MLQEDASDDGAPTQQQGQQADERHQQIKELPGIVLRWDRWRQMMEKQRSLKKILRINPLIFRVRWVNVSIQAHPALTVSRHVGVLALLYGGLVLQTDLNFTAVCHVIHDDLIATRKRVNICNLCVWKSLQFKVITLKLNNFHLSVLLILT